MGVDSVILLLNLCTLQFAINALDFVPLCLSTPGMIVHFDLQDSIAQVLRGPAQANCLPTVFLVSCCSCCLVLAVALETGSE